MHFGALGCCQGYRSAHKPHDAARNMECQQDSQIRCPFRMHHVAPRIARLAYTIANTMTHTHIVVLSPYMLLSRSMAEQFCPSYWSTHKRNGDEPLGIAKL